MNGTFRERAQVDLTMIGTLKALLDTGSVSRAAAALGVTQPSVSQMLRRLREYFGDELFVRTGHTMRPTPRALALGPMVDRVMRDVNLISQGDSEFDPASASREFIVCMTDIGEYLIIPDLAAAFASEAPGCKIRTRRIPQARLKEALELGEADLAIGTLAGADRSLRQLRLGEHSPICIASASGRWAEAPLTLDGYTRSGHVLVQRVSDTVDPITERLRAKAIHRRISVFVDNHFSAARVVAEADLLCTVPNHTMAAKLASMFPVKLIPLPFEFGRFMYRLLWHNRYQSDPAHIWLRKTVERSVRRTVL